MAGLGLAEMNAFVAIVEQRSFAKAAVQLGVSPSTLSESLRKLEERLAVRLIERTTRSVAPTEAGERLLTRLRSVLEDYAAALESINDFRDKPRGQLRVTIAAPAADVIMAPIVARFLAQFPEIRLEISVDDALTDIVAGRFDAGIRIRELLDRDTIAVRVAAELRLVVIASRAYLEGHGRPKTPHDLLSRNCIRLRLPSVGLLPWRFAQKGKSFQVAVDGALVVNDVPFALRAARDGLGLLQTHSKRVESFIAEGELETVLDDLGTASGQWFFSLLPLPSTHSRAVASFCRFSARGGKGQRRARRVRIHDRRDVLGIAAMTVAALSSSFLVLQSRHTARAGILARLLGAEASTSVVASGTLN
jgi:DNA-binding transcriptional LysR family regulator